MHRRLFLAFSLLSAAALTGCISPSKLESAAPLDPSVADYDKLVFRVMDRAEEKRSRAVAVASATKKTLDPTGEFSLVETDGKARDGALLLELRIPRFVPANRTRRILGAGGEAEIEVHCVLRDPSGDKILGKFQATASSVHTQSFEAGGPVGWNSNIKKTWEDPEERAALAAGRAIAKFLQEHH